MIPWPAEVLTAASLQSDFQLKLMATLIADSMSQIHEITSADPVITLAQIAFNHNYN